MCSSPIVANRRSGAIAFNSNEQRRESAPIGTLSGVHEGGPDEAADCSASANDAGQARVTTRAAWARLLEFRLIQRAVERVLRSAPESSPDPKFWARAWACPACPGLSGGYEVPV